MGTPVPPEDPGDFPLACCPVDEEEGTWHGHWDTIEECEENCSLAYCDGEDACIGMSWNCVYPCIGGFCYWKTTSCRCHFTIYDFQCYCDCWPPELDYIRTDCVIA